MLLVELATQGVKGCSPSSRAILKAGYNVLVPPPGVPAAVSALLQALLFNDGRGGDAALAAGNGPSRAGLTFAGNDGQTYRIIRSFGGAGALQRLGPGNAWAAVTQDTGEINQLLRGGIGVPTAAQFVELFVLSAGSFPSRRAESAAPSKAPGAAPAAEEGGHAPSASGERKIVQNALVARMLEESKATKKADPSMAQENLARLRVEMEQARTLEEKQFQLEGMQRRIYELEERLKRVDELVLAVETSQAGLKSGHSLQTLGLPADGLERIRKYDDAAAKLEENIRKVREDELAAQDRRPVRPDPVYLDRNFQIGIGAGLAAFALGMFFRDSGARYLALLDIPAFGFAALTALKWIGDLQTFESGERRLAVGKDREQKLVAEFDREYFTVKTAMKIVGAETGKDLLAVLERRSEFERKHREAEAALHAARSDPELLRALDEQDQLTIDAKKLEEEIAGSSGGATARDWRSIEAEIQEIEESLAAADAGLASPVTAVGGSFAAAAPAPQVGRKDPIPALLAMGQELLQQPVEALAAAVRDRAGQYLMALSDRRYSGLELDAGGHASAVAPGRSVPATQLEPGDLDLVYLSIRLTLIERFAAQLRFPLILEDPFAAFSDARQQLLARMLKHIGSQTQVLHATGSGVVMPIADNAAQL